LNAVYIDQTIANGVFGTQKDRMDLVSKLQNLERFNQALKLVTDDITKNEGKRREIEANEDRIESDVSRYEEELGSLQSEVRTNWIDQKKKAQKEVKNLLGLIQSQQASKSVYEDLQTEMDAKKTDLRVLNTKYQDARSLYYAAQKIKNDARRLIEAGKCGQCGQPSEDAGADMLKTAQAVIDQKEKLVAQLKTSVEKIQEELTKGEKRIRDYKINSEHTEDQLESAKELLSQAEKGAKEEEDRNAKLDAKKQSVTKQLTASKRALKACRDLLNEIDIERELYDYAKKAFHRSGMPMYLSAALCPVLNAAADEYAEIFYEGKIKVLFGVDDGEFCVSVINPAGSGALNGQSVGESAMAGVVAAFALRDVAPKTNLLILDEPGHGLDPEGARQFAQGLLKLKERYESLLVTTHNSNIEGVLSGETIWTVTKKHKISTLESI
jgi:DNA repair exonuclease SbcCD ATPase subunit